MRVLDYKATCLFKYLKERYSFQNYEKVLLRCSSFVEQKVVLREFYRNQTFTRDRLLGRLSALQNKNAFGLKEVILGFKDFFIAGVASILTLYLEHYDFTNLTIPISEVKMLGICLLTLVAFSMFFSWIEKIKDVFNVLPLKEIFHFELVIIEAVLADGREEIDFDVLMENVEKKLKDGQHL